MAEVLINMDLNGYDDNTQMQEAIVKLQKSLYWLLNNLDSLNVTSINTNQTTVKSEDGTTHLDGSLLIMSDGDGVQRLRAGLGSGEYVFTLYNAAGNATVTLDSDGNAVFSGKVRGASIEADSTIDVGTDLKVGNNIYLGEANEAAGTVKRVQFFEGNSDFQRAAITVTKASDDGADMRIIAPKIVLSTVDGVFSGNDKAFITTGYVGAYVTINGTDYPVHFE